MGKLNLLSKRVSVGSPEECGDMLVIKGQCATQEGVQHHATRPDVHLQGGRGANTPSSPLFPPSYPPPYLRAGVQFPRDDLGSSVVGGAAGGPQELSVLTRKTSGTLRHDRENFRNSCS